MEIKRVKHNLLCPVQYDDREYIFQECVLWVSQDADGNRQLRYSAILQDKAAKSIMRVPLETVDELEEKTA